MHYLLEKYLVERREPIEYRLCARALMRWLFAISIDRAEDAWAQHEALNKLPKDQWAKLKTPDGRFGYLRTGETGRYSHNPPVGVDPASIPEMRLSPGPHTELRAFLKRLLGSKATAGQSWANDWISATSDQSGAEQGAFKELLLGCLAALQQRGSLDAFCDDQMQKLRSEFRASRLTGSCYGSLLLLDRAWRKHADASLGFIFASLFPNPHAIEVAINGPVPKAVGKILGLLVVHAEALPWIEGALGSLQSDGEELQASDDSTSFDTFHDHLYESCCLFNAAYEGYTFLGAGVMFGEAQRKQFSISANVCAEFKLRAYTSLQLCFEEYLGAGHLDRYRKLVASKGKEAGEREADQYVTQLIVHELLYPESWRAYLMGKTTARPCLGTVA